MITDQLYIVLDPIGQPITSCAALLRSVAIDRATFFLGTRWGNLYNAGYRVAEAALVVNICQNQNEGDDPLKRSGAPPTPGQPCNSDK